MSDCRYESEVIDALASHRWPARIDAELRAHVAACESCRDLAAVAGALMSEETVAFADARVPLSASVWHRAQLRAREEAARVATRPIGFVQGVAFASALAATIAIAVWGLPMALALVPDLPALPQMPAALMTPSAWLPALDGDTPSVLMNTTVQLAIAAWALLTPVALYFALANND
jgi:hypothetical protein